MIYHHHDISSWYIIMIYQSSWHPWHFSKLIPSRWESQQPRWYHQNQLNEHPLGLHSVGSVGIAAGSVSQFALVLNWFASVLHWFELVCIGLHWFALVLHWFALVCICFALVLRWLALVFIGLHRFFSCRSRFSRFGIGLGSVGFAPNP